MFVIDQLKSARVRVEFEVPNPKEGATKPIKSDFIAVFAVVDQNTFKARAKESADQHARIAQALREAYEQKAVPEIEPEDLDEKFCREDLIGLEGIKDAEGVELLFSEDLVEQVFQHRYARAALIAAWEEHMSSPDKVRRKN